MPQGSPEAEVATYRSLVFAIAYRMLGSVAEAEDIVQEAFLRLHQARQAGVVVESPKAYLAALVTRIAIDHLRSARVRRESYFGTWLPEPVVREGALAADQEVERAESLSMAFMLILEALTPVERAVFLLREAFDYSYEEIAEIVGKSEENCRQIFARAKRHIDAGKRRFEPSAAKRAEIARRFFAACEKGELSGLVELLAADAAFHGDGGGKAAAFTRPVLGADRVSRLLAGVFAKLEEAGARIERVEVNGQPGAKLLDRSGRVFAVWALDIADGKVQCVRSVVNPEKLRHLGPVSDLLRLPRRGGPDALSRSSEAATRSTTPSSPTGSKTSRPS
jgi:RNA polymerase sigma-70 factor (ECF subfamily)